MFHMKSMLKSNPLLKIASSSLVYLPCPANISYLWNYGSLLGVILVVQIASGFFLSMFYVSDSSLAFSSVDHIMRDVNYGWLLRVTHANGASMFFMLLYIHIGRGLFYESYIKSKEVWLSGTTILLLVMATAFLGYVLPWGQMSFWGATVITNLFSAIPYMGSDIVLWMWGGYSVSGPTLTRFYSLHFLVPFVILGFVMIHLLFLHHSGSSNPLGVSGNLDKLVFAPYYAIKDILGFIIMFMVLFYFVFFNSWLFGDPENFIPANALVTPVHIQPEWYFLFAYAILRSIPNKLGGVVALLFSVVILYIISLSLNFRFYYLSLTNYSYVLKVVFISLVVVFFLLTWIGARPVEHPYVLIGQVLTVVYFMLFFILYVWISLVSAKLQSN